MPRAFVAQNDWIANRVGVALFFTSVPKPTDGQY